MTRQLFSLALGACLLALLPPSHADAVEMPVRKAGLWEMKTLQTGSPMPEMTMQQCTDATTDKDMSSAFSPASKDSCSKQDIQKTATGYVTDSRVRRRRHDDHIAFRDHRRFQLRLHREHAAKVGEAEVLPLLGGGDLEVGRASVRGLSSPVCDAQLGVARGHGLLAVGLLLEDPRGLPLVRDGEARRPACSCAAAAP